MRQTAIAVRGARRRNNSTPQRVRTRPAPVVTAPIAPLLLSVPQVAVMLGMCERKAWTLIGRGDIFSVLVGRSRRIPRKAVEEYVEHLISSVA